MSDYKLKYKIRVTGTITALSGLAIGGSYSPMSIGAPDSIVIRNPVSNKPYIPGSSIKGKMRSLIELRDGSIDQVNMNKVKYGPSQDVKTISAKLFGIAKGSESRPSRVIVRDAEVMQDLDFFSNTDLPYTESKTEVVLDRVTSKAMPRTIERVPAGAQFPLDLIINVFEGEANGVRDDESLYIKNVLQALVLLQNDYLGGKGSRGSGQVEIKVTKIERRSAAFYRGEAASEDITSTLNIPEELRA